MAVLAAISVNSALLYLAQRQLANTAASAAVAGAGAISQSAFYHSGQLVLSPRRASAIAEQAVASEAPGAARSIAVSVVVSGNEVCVSLAGKAQAIFGSRLPGGWSHATVRAAAAATPALGGRPVPHVQPGCMPAAGA